MRLRILVTLCVLVVLVQLPLSGAAVQAAPNPGAQSLPIHGFGWEKITVDAGPGVGQSLSMALNPVTRNPYISYYDSSTTDLKLAFPVSSGGDCGPGNTWSCNSLKYTNTETFGGFSSIDFNGAGNWGISFVKSHPLSAVAFTGTPASGNTQFFSSVEGVNYLAYLGTSFRFTPGGTASFAYIGMDNAINFIINFASYNPASGGNCGMLNHWDCETIALGSAIGLSGYPSLGYWGSIPEIAYRDPVGRPYFAVRIGGGLGDCPYSLNWLCLEVDHNSFAAGGLAYVSNPPQGAMAYYDGNTHYMVVAIGTTGICGWTCNYIEDVGAQQTDANGIAIAMRNGKYIVAYTSHKSANTILKVAYQDPNGNCGPVVGLSRSWRCEVVDDGGGIQSVGQFISMSVSSSGVVYIAYSNDTDKTLKLAYRMNNLFLPLARK